MKNINFLNIGKKTILGIATSMLLVNSASAVENKVYAVVNGDNITKNDIALIIRDPRVQFNTLPQETQKGIINKLIEQKLLSQDILKSSITKTKEYRESLNLIKQNLALQVWMQLEHQKLIVSEKDINQFYMANKAKFNQPEQYHARHILVKTDSEAKEIIYILNKSVNKKTKFIELAKTKSTGPSGVNGGDLGFFTADKMVPEFSQATAKLKIGAITQAPVKTQFGYHIIFLEDKKDATLIELKSIKDKIVENIKQNKIMQKLTTKAIKLKKTAKIEYK